MYDDFVFSEGCMIGAIVAYVTTQPPPNTLRCDGSQYERVDYPILYSLLPAALIVDADNFITPDLRDRFLVGAGGSYSGLDTGGANSVTLSVDEMPAHSHTAQPHSHTVTGAVALPDAIGEIPEPGATATPQITSAETVILNNTGGGAAHENRPPYFAVGYCMVAR
jgi:microcystin-dependent protein